MIDYSTIANTSGAFPDVIGLNCTGPSTTDGTPYIAAVINDLWGARQALMSHAGLTPDSVTEADGASQQLTAIQRVTIGPGCVVAWAGDAADPSSLGRRMIQLNGQGILRASYTDLDTVVYCGNGDNPTASAFYHADDAAGTIRNTTGVYLILPDLRGATIRGLDTAAARDPGGASRDIGNYQSWAIAIHDHYVWKPTATSYVGAVAAIDWDLTTPDKYAIEMTASGTESATEIMADSIPTGTIPSGNQSSESRMCNIAMRWVITY